MTMRAAVCALILFSATAAEAAKIQPFEWGYDLQAMCSMPRDSMQYGVCLGLVSGYFEGFRHKCTLNSNAITRPKLVDVVMNFYLEHPERRRSPAFDSATEALMKAYDCTRSENEKDAN